MDEMTVTTRIEAFLARIVNGSGEIPEPETDTELYLAAICGESVTLPEPDSRFTTFLARILGENVALPVPQTRAEMYLAKICGEDVTVPVPLTRLDAWLALWAESGGGTETTVTGVAPIVLEAALAHHILSLTQYGKCTQEFTPAPDAPVDIMTNNGAIKVRRQSGMPLAYQMVEWLKSTGTIPITGFKTKSTQEIATVFYRERSGASYLYSSDTNTSGTTNTTAYLTSGAGNWRWDGKSYSVSVSAGIKITSIQNKDGVWLNGTKYGSYTDAGEFISTNDLRLSSSENTTVRIYSMTIREGETVTLDLVPVQRISDSAYGFYDKVSGEFYTNAEATFEAGDPIADPVEIYTDGTPEVLTVSGANLLDPSTVPEENRFILSQGGGTQAPSPTGGVFRHSAYIPIKEGTKYFFGMTPYAASSAGIAWYSTTEAASYISGMNGSTLKNSYSMKATAPAGAKYIRFSWRIDEGYDTDWEHSVYLCECDSYSGPIISAWQAYVTPQTVNDVPMLLSVGDYEDEVEIISGDVDRNVWVVVFTGAADEPWQEYDGRFYIHTPDTPYPGRLGVGPLAPPCTRFRPVATGFYGLADGDIEYSAGEQDIELYTTGASTVAELRAVLSGWMAEGNPFVVCYPRETATEQGTPHALHTNAGTNVVDVSAAVGSVELAVEYYTSA